MPRHAALGAMAMVALSARARSRGRIWWQALRPKTLSLAVVPIVVGTSWAGLVHASVDVVAMALALIAAIAIQIGTNLWNDALDAERGVDDGDRLGPTRATAAGLVAALEVRRAALSAFALALVLGLALVLEGGLAILVIGVGAIACGLLYSAGPKPIAATPLGEVVVVAFFGVAGVVGTVVLNSAPVTGVVWSLGLLTGLPAAAVLLVNNHRDRVADRRAGRRTLAIVLGSARTKLLYAALLLAAAVAPLVAGGGATVAGAVFTGGLIYAALALIVAVRRAPIDGSLNELLAKTARYQLLVATAVVAGLLARGPAIGG